MIKLYQCFYFVEKSISKNCPNYDMSIELAPRLKDRAAKFEANLAKKFNWDFDQELDDDAPVVVDLGDDGGGGGN